LAPKSDGNGFLTAADVTQARRYIAGLDSVLNGSIFQRLDCAPRGTLGSGSLTSADLVQVRRYTAALDPPQEAGGPTAPVKQLQLQTEAPPNR
jgi:hypothetical protein